MDLSTSPRRRLTAWLFGLGLGLCLPSCAAAPPGKGRLVAGAPGTGGAATATATARRIGVDPALLAQVPKGAVAALVIGGEPFTWLRKALLGEPALRAELEPFLLRKLGVDPTQLDGLVGYVLIESAGRLDAALSLRIPRGRASTKDAALVGRVLTSHAGTSLVSLELGPEPLAVAGQPIVAALTPGGLLIGTPGAVRAGIDRAQGQGPALDLQSRLARLLSGGAWGDLDLAIDATRVPGLGVAAAAFGIETAALSLSMERIQVELAGQATPLAALKQKADAFAAKLLKETADAKSKALAQDDLVTGALAIVGHHNTDRLVRLATPQLLGDRLVIDARLPTQESSAMVITAVTGILAAVAIPSFLKFQARARTAEAKSNLKAIQFALQSWHAEHGHGKGWRLPGSTEWTPATSCCASRGATCAARVGDFSAGAWKAIGFDPGTDLRYQYRIQSSGRGASSRVTLEARGDLDCDGRQAEFRLEGSISADGELRFGELRSENDTE